MPTKSAVITAAVSANADESKERYLPAPFISRFPETAAYKPTPTPAAETAKYAEAITAFANVPTDKSASEIKSAK